MTGPLRELGSTPCLKAEKITGPTGFDPPLFAPAAPAAPAPLDRVHDGGQARWPR